MKKTLALFLAMMAIFAFGVCAIELDTAENAAEVAAEETAVLAAVELKPGLNVYTGTTKPYTFDGAEAEVDTEKFNFTATVETYATSANAENKAMHIDKTYEHFGLKEFPVIELERPVILKFNALNYSGQVRYCVIGDVKAGREKADVVTTLNKGNFTYVATASTQTQTNVANQGASAFVDSYATDYEGKPFENIYFYGYSGTMNAYVDDLAVIPYYAINFNNNGGVGSNNPVEYFYVDEGESYTIKTPANFYTKDGKPSLGWALTPDATEPITSFVPTPGKDINLYAVYDEDFVEDEVKPGLNMFTGTEDALTFDGEGFDLAALTNLKTNSVTVETKEVTAGDGNKALAMNARNDYISFVNFPKVNVDRPFSVALDIFYSGQVRYMAVDEYNFNNSTKADSIVIYGKSKTAWTPLTYTISGSQTNSTGTGGHLNSGYQQRQIPNIYVYMYTALAATENSTYIDNLKLIPHYKVNYNVNGGTGSAIANEYFYVAAGSAYTLKNTANDLVKGDLVFVGWALTPDATVNDVVTTVTPELGKDVTLYAVYGTPVVVTLVKDGTEYAKYNTYADNVITVNGSYFANADNYYVNWQTEDGKAVIANKYTFNENATLNAVKYARKMTIGENAFSNGDFEENYIEVRPSAGNLFIVEDDEEHGNVLKYQRINSGYGSVQRGVIWETGRKYRIEYDAKLPAAVANQYNRVYGGADHAAAGTAAIANEWVHTGVDYLHTATSEPTNGDVFTLYINPVPAGVENIVYYDNLKLIPYHKVTFNANGAEGTAPAVDFTLDATYTITAGAGELTKDGFYLAGWATSADGEVVESVDTVVGEDIELFAVWAPVADENAPESDSENFSMRAGEKAGMRFYASVTASQKSEATEYGFVVARADILEAIGYDNAELKIGLDYNGNSEGKLYVKGAAYVAGTELDKYITEEDGKIIFAAVCTGLDITNKTQVTTKFVVRPYINIGGAYAYGKPVVKSLYEVAKMIDTSTLHEDIVTYINTIIATAEAE